MDDMVLLVQCIVYAMISYAIMRGPSRSIATMQSNSIFNKSFVISL